jgi:predicted PurR-regulated permease PerM
MPKPLSTQRDDRAPLELRVPHRPPTRRVTGVRLLVAGAVGTLLYFAHVAFVPLALAALLALILSSPVEMLRGLGVPRGVSALLLMILMVGVVAAVTNLLYEPAQHWFAEAPSTLKVIERKIRPVAQFVNRLDVLRNSAGNIGNTIHPPAQTPAAAPAAESAPAMILDLTRGIVFSTVTVVILTLFLLAGGPPMLARMTSALVSDLAAGHVIDVIEHVRREVGRFYVTTALINVGLAVATGAVMDLCGMPNPFLWGTIAGLLNFIPYAGSTTSLIMLSLVAVVSFDNLARVVAVAGSFLVLVVIEGQVVQPLLVGRRLELNPLLVFLSLWFGGLFWGIAGIVLATPALVALKVIAEHSTAGTPLREFLSPDDL